MIIGNSRYAPLWLSIISTARWWNNLKRRVEDCQTYAVVHRQTDTDKWIMKQTFGQLFPLPCKTCKDVSLK